MSVLASLLLASGVFSLYFCFIILCFTVLQEVSSSVRVSVAPRGAVNKHKEESWDRRVPRCVCGS